MALTLVVDPGSTSRKYAFYRGDQTLFSVHAEMTETGVTSCLTEVNGVSTCEDWSAGEITNAFARTLSWATEKGLLGTLSDIDRVAVRIVAPGEQFAVHTHIDDAYLEALTAAAPLVPVHIPIVLEEIRAVREHLPNVPLIATSDSAFHVTALPETRTVALGNERIYGYGYHGLSAASVVRQLPDAFGTMPSRTILLHVGGGVSVIALRDGQTMATSMGHTPASGVVMGSRGGTVSADAMLAYLRTHDLTPTEALQLLYTGSGMKALCGESDMRVILDRVAAKDAAAELAFAAYVYSIQSTIAAYTVLLGGLDAVVLTATAVVRNPYLRSRLLGGLEVLNIILDTDKNDVLVGKSGRIEARSSVPVFVTKTDEMGEMARIVAGM